MELDQTKISLRSLADRRDPATGKQFQPNIPYQTADAIRALFMALETSERQEEG